RWADMLASSASPEALVGLFRQGLDFQRHVAQSSPPRPEFVFLAKAEELDVDEVAPKFKLARHCLRQCVSPGPIGMLLCTDVLGSGDKCKAVAASLLNKPWLSYLI